MRDAILARGDPPITVLIVDDDEDARDLLCVLLQKRGFVVETVDSGSSCLERLADPSEKPVSIVVTDVEMPGMSGIELCSLLRDQYPDIVAIVISGRVTAASITAAIETGAFVFLPKPVSVNALAGVLRRANEMVVDHAV